MNSTAAQSANTFDVLKALGPVGLFGLIALTFGLVTYPSFIWILSQLAPDTNNFILIIAGLGAAGLFWKMGLPRRLLPTPALGLILMCALASVWTLSILQQLSASFALLGLYGFFAGLERVSAGLWRKGLIMAGLTALALPFALVPGTGMGFYLRLVTADAAAQLLALMGHQSLGAHDVLIFDNGIAQVDLPCSGLKSLFTGTGIFFIASLILRRAVSLKWLLGYSVFAGLLIIANTARVTILIWVSEILERRAIAETIHMPLGVVLFCIVCAGGIYILCHLPRFNRQGQPDKVSSSQFMSYFVGIALSLVLITMFWLTPQRTFPIGVDLTPPQSLELVAIDLTPTEVKFFGARERTSAGKWMFDYKGLSGSMLVVRSGAANGLHAPEVCMLGNGISVDNMESRQALDGGHYRWLTVDQSRRNAVYWMQSDKTITDDFRKRLSRYVLSGQNDWVMVTLLFDNRLNLSENAGNKAVLDALMVDLQSHYAQDILRKKT